MTATAAPALAPGWIHCRYSTCTFAHDRYHYFIGAKSLCGKFYRPEYGTPFATLAANQLHKACKKCAEALATEAAGNSRAAAHPVTKQMTLVFNP